MMIFRRRLLFWLFKAYLKKWGKVISVSFLLGLVIFFILISSSEFLVQLLPFEKRTTVGIVGAYNADTLPPTLQSKLSRGLTKISDDGKVEPDVSEKWRVENNGKTYVFTLKKNIFFSDGRRLTSDLISYDFKDVSVKRADKYTIAFTLRDPYAPFLVTVSRPLFRDGLTGVGAFRISDIKLNGNFVETLSIISRQNRFHVETYKFYPSEDAVKMAFALGEITKMEGLSDDSFKSTSFSKYPAVQTSKTINSTKLVTLFYNTQDNLLSDKKMRSGLTYALPDTFPEGERAYTPFSKNSYFYNEDLFVRKQDLAHAKLLVDASYSGTESAKFTIQTLDKYKKTAEIIAAAWKNVGINTKIEVVDTRPAVFQLYLGDFTTPRDPDQYTLWHSDQNNNITKYKNLRIDKLLEDGRKTIDLDERRSIYEDFQKYLIDDSPASFLYFPYEFSVEKS